MSYNGVGLSTARGSGTSGFVQRNLSALRPQRKHHDADRDVEPAKAVSILANGEIIEHKKKRAVEVEVMKMRIRLEADKSLDEDQIVTKLDELRQSLLKDGMSSRNKPSAKERETHELARRAQEKNERMRRAFGIQDDYQIGQSFDRELATQEREERQEIRPKGQAPHNWLDRVGRDQSPTDQIQPNRRDEHHHHHQHHRRRQRSPSQPVRRRALPRDNRRGSPPSRRPRYRSPRRRSRSRSRSLSQSASPPSRYAMYQRSNSRTRPRHYDRQDRRGRSDSRKPIDASKTISSTDTSASRTMPNERRRRRRRSPSSSRSPVCERSDPPRISSLAQLPHTSSPEVSKANVIASSSSSSSSPTHAKRSERARSSSRSSVSSSSSSGGIGSSDSNDSDVLIAKKRDERRQSSP